MNSLFGIELLLYPEEFLDSYGLGTTVESGENGQQFVGLDLKSRGPSSQVDEDDKRRLKLRNLLQARQRVKDVTSDHSSNKACAIHKDIDLHSAFSRGKGFMEPINMGYLDEVFANSECRLCRFLQNYLSKFYTEILQAPGAPVQCLLFSTRSKYSQDVDYAPGPSDEHSKLLLHLARPGPDFEPTEHHLHTGIHFISNELYSGRRVEDQIDISLVQSWLRRCREEHKEICRPEKLVISSDPLRNLRLIDVTSRWVITCSETCEYIALSYVWGPESKQTFRSWRKNSMDSYNQLVNLELPQSVARTIEDAIIFTKLLGFRFLWVDALCIVQDDEKHVKTQISQMSQVYGCAAMTIVAAGGEDAQSPLPGLSPGSRQNQQVSEDMDGCIIANKLPRSKIAIQSSVWNTRGWTFQERLLSKRLIVMTQTQAFFQCDQDCYCEDTRAELDSSQLSPIARSRKKLKICTDKSSLNSNSFFGNYCLVVETYTKRNLSRCEDMIPAIDGVLQVWRRTLGIEFIYGLPKHMIACSLLWQPAVPLLRRMSGGATVKQQYRNCSHSKELSPSWSWAAWKGEVIFSNTVNDPENFRSGIVLETSRQNSTKPNHILDFWSDCAYFPVQSPPKGSDMNKIDTIQATENVLNADTSTISNALILDHNGEEAGEILIDTSVELPQSKSKFIFICEAKTTTRTVWRRGWGGDVDEHFVHNDVTADLEFVPGVAEIPWSYVKVMLVCQTGSIVCRIGIGTIHKDAWKAAKPRRELIRLS